MPIYVATIADHVEDQLTFDDSGVNPSQPGAITYNGGAFVGRDAFGTFDLRAGASVLANTLLTNDGGLVYGADGDLILKE